MYFILYIKDIEHPSRYVIARIMTGVFKTDRLTVNNSSAVCPRCAAVLQMAN